MTDDQGEEQALSRVRTRSRARIVWSVIAIPLIALLVVIGAPLASPLFPAETITSCTVEKKNLKPKRSITPKVNSDCGVFTSVKTVDCTNTLGKSLALIPGFTYDLVVRGPRIPLITQPVIVSAAVSPEQKNTPDWDRFDTPSEIEGVQKLQEQFSPDTLRAFDYEQPPYDPQCQVSRHVMTAKGLQLVDPARAERLLAVPAGVAPRDPKLPCEGFPCSDPVPDE